MLYMQVVNVPNWKQKEEPVSRVDRNHCDPSMEIIKEKEVTIIEEAETYL